MPLAITQVDSFTDKPFAGNPAGVCILPSPKDDQWMQNVAREMNLAETAFLVRQGDAYSLRWFTPTVEVDLCGHATLASAHVLWETGTLAPHEEARFDTRSGRLTAIREGEWITLNFPATPPAEVQPPPGLREALGNLPFRYTGKSVFDYLVELESEQAVRTLSPGLGTLATLPARGVIVTARATTAPYDFVSRFFGPAAGVDEDPVTGSAHCCLGPYWQVKLGKDDLLAYQASARGGDVRVRVKGDRILLSGKAVTVFRADLLV